MYDPLAALKKMVEEVGGEAEQVHKQVASVKGRSAYKQPKRVVSGHDQTLVKQNQVMTRKRLVSFRAI